MTEPEEALADGGLRSFYEQSFAKDYSGTSEKYERACKILCQSQRVLDIGCGDGSFLTLLQETCSIRDVYGAEISDAAVSMARQRGIRVQQVDIGTDSLPFPDEYFDGIFCGEVIEHLVDPDHLLDEAHRVLKSGGQFVLTTPNLASWFNRIFLLLGYQPIFTEVSLRHGVGHPFPFWLKAGHLRIFTLRALRELVELHQFKIIKTIGFGVNTRLGYGRRWRTTAVILNKLFRSPAFSSDLMLVMTK